MWRIHFTDGTETTHEWTGSNIPEHRIEWAIRGLAETHFGKRVFSATPLDCSGLALNCHFGIPCSVHPNA